MRLSSRLLFASSNRHKFAEAQSILGTYGIELEFFSCSLQEIQSDSIRTISRHKARHAFKLCKRQVIVEDDGLEINSLGGFPGPYSSFAFGTIGNKGILRLVGRSRAASFASVITYCDGSRLTSFEARVPGRISKAVRGRGWGYDPIFIADGQTKTFAELAGKNSVSHRYESLKKFSNWFLHR